MQGTRYNVPLLNALVFYVGIEVRINVCHITMCLLASSSEQNCSVHPSQLALHILRLNHDASHTRKIPWMCGSEFGFVSKHSRLLLETWSNVKL